MGEGGREEEERGEEERPVQYIILRNDLGYSAGELVAQGAHAATLALHETRDREDTVLFLLHSRRMTVVALECSEEEMERVEKDLLSASPSVPFRVWIEMPENRATGLSLAPFFRTRQPETMAILRRLKLLK